MITSSVDLDERVIDDAGEGGGRLPVRQIVPLIWNQFRNLKLGTPRSVKHAKSDG